MPISILQKRIGHRPSRFLAVSLQTQNRAIFGLGTVAVTSGVRPIEIFSCSVVKRMGYKEGFQWLSQYIA